MKHVECVCDFNGTFKSPGICADIHQIGELYFIDFQGDWEFYDSRLNHEFILFGAFVVTGLDFNEVNDILNGPAAKAADFILSLERIPEHRLMEIDSEYEE